ncbi:hypothetical protein BFW38_16640 [Terasakiispira papahanaumokuakeensis]|uniref:HTH araC/xylS-type domain-containing protein n=1 Tax=Terasakiispira papahanaumokuakeensis TaxID=197479 RepID=A0A1E2VDM0_9GAMM|nr:AraC family transcriptional regulator [Terasakiispira papahanaumokuakeensis]ODC04916.1 hypothetical protein BFW38_16640 [Terasakiispira papahanaumokuakeensis]
MSTPSTSCQHVVYAQQLREISQVLAHNQAFEAPQWTPREPLLNGQMSVFEIQPGLLLRRVDVYDRYDLLSQAQLHPGIKISLVLEGQAEVAFDQQVIQLRAPDAGGVIVTLPKTAAFSRYGYAGRYERTLTLTMMPEWLQNSGIDWLYLRNTFNEARLQPWQPSIALRQALTALFSPQLGSTTHEAQRLQITGYALALAGEALDFMALPEHYRRPRYTQAQTDPRIARLLRQLDAGQGLMQSQETLATQLNMSLSALQRQFRRHTGETLGHYLRHRRLKRAQQSLSQGQTTIDEAAALAGYTSAANFATAFKKTFGLNPRDCQNHDPLHKA